MSGIWTSLIGLIGVVAGVALNEIIRRSRRVETFTPAIFEKRLAKYEELMRLVQTGYEIACDVIENPAYSAEERCALISGAIAPIAKYVDQEELYIDGDLGAHCVAMFMGAEDVHSIEDEPARKAAEQEIRNQYIEAKRMIREDSGIHEINKLFKKIHKTNLGGSIIERIQYLRRNLDKSQRQARRSDANS